MAVWLDGHHPVLCWSNRAGEAFTVESTTNLVFGSWQRRLTVTSDGREMAWRDDGSLAQQAFYRLSLATNSARFGTLQRALERACTNQGIVGASAAALLPEEGLWLGVYGTSDGLTPILPHTPFEVGSVTKTLVAATVLRLAEEGKLALDDTLEHWLPSLRMPNIPTGVTVRQLLGHRAGIYNFGDDPDFRQALFSDWSRRWQPEEVLAYLKAPYFAPGADGQYSNSGYVLLGMIVRKATGSTMAAAMRRTVLERAGLSNTFMGAEEAWNGVLADPHLDFDGDGFHEDLGSYPQTAILTSFWTSGAEISTASDLVHFGRSLFEDGLLTPASLAAMGDFQSIDVGGTRYDYGLGLMRFNILGSEYWAHSGGLFGEFAWVSYCPSTRICLAVTYNHPIVKTGPSLPGELLIALASLTNAPAGSAPMLSTDDRQPLSASLRIPFLNSEVSSEDLEPVATQP
jgi:D-alanyl-D-alanine carboxypeptidase